MEEEGMLHNVLEAKLQTLLWYRSLLGEGTIDPAETVEIRRRGNTYEGKLLSGTAWVSSGLLEPVIDDLLQDARQALQKRLDERVDALGDLARKLHGDRTFTVPAAAAAAAAPATPKRDIFSELFDLAMGMIPRRPSGGVEPAYYPPAPAPKTSTSNAPSTPCVVSRVSTVVTPAVAARLRDFFAAIAADLGSGDRDRIRNARVRLAWEASSGAFANTAIGASALQVLGLLMNDALEQLSRQGVDDASSPSLPRSVKLAAEVTRRMVLDLDDMLPTPTAKPAAESVAPTQSLDARVNPRAGDLELFVRALTADLASESEGRIAQAHGRLIAASHGIFRGDVPSDLFDYPALAQGVLKVVACVTPYVWRRDRDALMEAQKAVAEMLALFGEATPSVPADAPAAAAAPAPADERRQAQILFRNMPADQPAPATGTWAIEWKANAPGHFSKHETFAAVERDLANFALTYDIDAVEVIAYNLDGSVSRDDPSCAPRSVVVCAVDAYHGKRGAFPMTSFPDGVKRYYLGTMAYEPAVCAPAAPAAAPPPPVKLDTVGRYFLANLWQHLRPDLRTPKSIATAARALREMAKDEAFDTLRKVHGAELELIERSLREIHPPMRADASALQQTYLSREAGEAAVEAERAALDNVAEIAKDLYDRSR